MRAPRRIGLRLLWEQPRLSDAAIAAALFAVDLLVSWDRSRLGTLPAVVVPAYAAIAYLALAFRRQYPRGVFTLLVLHAALADLTLPAYFPTVGLWLALYTVAAHSDLPSASLALLAAAVPTALSIADTVRRQPPADRTSALISTTVALVLINLALFGVGRWVSWSSARHRLSEHNAAVAIAAERTRIARDLHDVVAHAITLMLLQAGGAAGLLRKDPERAATALEHVDTLGQQALIELRRMLDLLRLDSAPPGQAAAAPPTGVAGIAELVSRARAGAVPMELAVTGVPRPIEPGVDMCAYRIAQEALTNAARYADPATPVRVLLSWLPGGLELSVENRCPAAQDQPSGSGTGGYGLIGMRERAASVGGRFTAGAQPDGTFLVTATLPAVADLRSLSGDT